MTLHVQTTRSRSGVGNHQSVSTDQGTAPGRVRIFGYIDRTGGRFELSIFDWMIEELNLREKSRTFNRQREAIDYALNLEEELFRQRGGFYGAGYAAVKGTDND